MTIAIIILSLLLGASVVFVLAAIKVGAKSEKRYVTIVSQWLLDQEEDVTITNMEKLESDGMIFKTLYSTWNAFEFLGISQEDHPELSEEELKKQIEKPRITKELL